MIKGYCSMVADLFHYGHLRYLEICKENCDFLIVGILTDKATMIMKPKPIIPYADRRNIIRAIGCVDLVVRQDCYYPLEGALSCEADILFESDSHNPEQVEKSAKRMKTIVIPYYEGISSTEIKNKIVKEWRIK